MALLFFMGGILGWNGITFFIDRYLDLSTLFSLYRPFYKNRQIRTSKTKTIRKQSLPDGLMSYDCRVLPSRLLFLLSSFGAYALLGQSLVHHPSQRFFSGRDLL